MSVPKPDNEARRLAALQRYQILDTARERTFDDFTQLASYICGTPISTITLVDAERQWFKSQVGLEFADGSREDAFCAYTILGTETLVVENAATDERFANNPLVTSSPHIRFYAGAPLIDRDGHALGSLCVIDRKPRQLQEAQLRALEALSRQVMAQLELRRTSSELATALAEVKTLHGLLPICSHCKGTRNDEGYWESIEQYLRTHTDMDLSHGICPACFEKHYPEIFARRQAREAEAGGAKA